MAFLHQKSYFFFLVFLSFSKKKNLSSKMRFFHKFGEKGEAGKKTSPLG